MGRILRYQCIIKTNRSSLDKGLGSDEVQILEEDFRDGKRREEKVNVGMKLDFQNREHITKFPGFKYINV